MDSNEKSPDIDRSMSVDISVSDSFAGPTSTPKSKRAEPAKNVSNVRKLHFKVPAFPAKKATITKLPKKKKPKAVCNECGKTYAFEGIPFKNHMRSHAIVAATTKYPDKNKILTSLTEIVKSTLQQVMSSPSGGCVTESASYFFNEVEECLQDTVVMKFAAKVCDLFLSSAELKQFALPSELLAALVKESDKILCTFEIRAELVGILSGTSFENETLQVFLCEYVICFTEVLLKFIAESVAGDSVKTKKPYECDEEARQVIHYVAGAILRGFYKRAKRYPKSAIWASVKEQIIPSLVERETAESTPVIDKEWTKSVDRGSLIYVSNDCLEFLVLVAEIMEKTEDQQGCISYINVYEKICNSMALTVNWDRMIGDAVSEELSVQFMKSFIKAFCQTYGAGIKKRRINKLRERPEASVNLRHSLAPKKVP